MGVKHQWKVGFKDKKLFRLSLLHPLGELEVDADTAVLASGAGGAAGADRDEVLVESDIEDGASSVNVDKGMADGAARADGSHSNDLDIAGSRAVGEAGVKGDGGSGGGGTDETEGSGEETHVEGWNGLICNNKVL